MSAKIRILIVDDSEEIREMLAAADVQLHVATEPAFLKVKSPKATRYK